MDAPCPTKPFTPEPLGGTSGRLLYIDALRGLAASYVLIYHFYGYLSQGHTIQRFPYPIHQFLINGWLGVEIFFVLSGFVISYSARNAQVTGRFIGRFALRRSLRLDPPYWVTILLTYIFLRLAHGALVPESNGLTEGLNFLSNMFYLDNVLGMRSIVKVGWTLCLEVQFYLTYILLLWLMQRLSREWWGTGGRFFVFAPLAVYSLMLITGLASFPLAKFFVDYWYMFFLGVMACWVLTKQVKLKWAYIYIGVALLSLALKWDIRTVVAVATAVSIIIVGKLGKLSSALNWKWSQYLGRISYSLYLVHPLVGHRILGLAVHRFGNPPSPIISWLVFLTATAASIMAAILMNKLIERPSQALSKRVALQSSLRLPAAETKLPVQVEITPAT